MRAKPGYNPLSRNVEESDKQFLHAKLVETGLPCPFQWIDGPESITEFPMLNAPRLINDLIGDFIEDKGSFLAKCQVTPSEIMWLAERTTAQRKSHLLGQYRRLCNFGEVIKACKRHINIIPSSPHHCLRG